MRRIFCILAGFLAVFSCTMPDEKPTPESTKKGTITLRSQNSVVLPVEGGSATISFTASGDWTAAVANDRGDWLSISPASGSKDEGSITVSAQENPDTEDRSAVVRISCGSATASVTVTQKQKDALTQTPSKTQFGAEGGTFSIEVKANVDYTFEIAGDWIHQSSTRAMTTKSTVFTVDKNDDTRKREGSVTVRSSLGSEKVTIYQEAGAPSIVLSADNVSVKTEGGSFTVDVNTNVDVTMAIVAGGEWLSEMRTRAMSTHSYTFMASANETPEQRVGKISFKNAENGVEAIVTVTQMQKDALVITQDVYEIGANGGEVSIEAASNVELDVQVSEPWVQQVSTRAFSTQSYVFTVEPNSGYDVRECTITFSGGNVEVQDNYTQESPWSIIGTIGGDSWTRDIEMKTDGTWHVARGVAVTASDEFKFRKNKDWTVNLGYVTYQITVVAVDAEVALVQDGGNMKLPVGAYDMYLNPGTNVAFFLPTGTPFNYGGGAGAATQTALSQTVTIRQDGADGFIADFKDKYTLSSREQTLELRSRSSVEIQAQSQADWITVIETRALSNRAVVLQIAKNTTEDARSGKVTVSAPSLGISQEVTIMQMGSGNIYIPDAAFLAYLLKQFDTDSDGTLSQSECDEVTQIEFDFADYPEIESLAGLDYFPNLAYVNCYGSNKLKEVDFSGNKKLDSFNVSDCPALTTINASNCTNLWYVHANNDGLLSKLMLPSEDIPLKYFAMWNANSMPEEIDLSMCPELQTLSFTHSGNVKKIWLRTGVNLIICNAYGVEMLYKGDDPFADEIVFVDEEFKRLVTAYYGNSYDVNHDGKFSKYELSRLPSVSLCPDYVSASGVITSLEDLVHFTNAVYINIIDYRDKVAAPIPNALKSLKNLRSISFDNCRIQGTLPEWIGQLKRISFNNSYPLGNGEPLPLEMLDRAKFEYFDLRGCAYGDTHLTVPNSWLVEATENVNDLVWLMRRSYPQQRVSKPGQDGGSYYASPAMTFRSEVDGTGAVHPDGEAVLYHTATRGRGVDIVITGDGFTAENNTVGGTMETYLTACAESIFKISPYDRLQEYFNVWLVYAHSRNEGTSDSNGFTKFGAYQPDVAYSTCKGNSSSVVSFLSSATGRDCSQAICTVVMNTPFYGGTCWWSMYSLANYVYAVGYVPANQLYPDDFIPTFYHEVLGHGVGRLADEYDADSANPGSVPTSDNSDWAKYGRYSNVDCQSDPALIQWHRFLADQRYAEEGLGVFEGAKYANSGWYRPTNNSIMRHQNAEGGEAFNAPSREAIYQWALLLSDESGRTWSNWTSFLSEVYDYETFVALDKAPSPNPSPLPKKVRRMASEPRRFVMRDGTVLGERPPHTPPQVTVE